MYVVGVGGLISSATELVIAFLMGLAGSMNWALHGMVDIRFVLIILAGSLLGVQLGAIGTTYVKESMIKIVIATIMLIVAVSRALAVPQYLVQLHLMNLPQNTIDILGKISFIIMCLALLTGAFIILGTMWKAKQAEQLLDGGDIVWIDGGGMHLQPSGNRLDVWFEEALEVACLFGPDRLLFAYPDAVTDHLLPQWVPSILQNHRIDTKGPDSHFPMSISAECLRYIHPKEQWDAVHQRKPAFVVVPQPIFPKRRLSMAAWRTERMLRSLPCPLLILPRPSTRSANQN